MNLPTRPAADPLDDIDREASGVDSQMARQDRADLPDQRSDQPANGTNDPGDVYIDATREVSEHTGDLDELSRDGTDDGDEADLDLARDSLAPAEAGLGA